MRAAAVRRGFRHGLPPSSRTLARTPSPSILVVLMRAIQSRAVVRFSNLRASHPFPRFGPANQVTAFRALLAAVVVGLIPMRPSPNVAVAAVIAGGVCAILDGVDGWLARRTRMASAFGARFDMEVDALLILALAVVVWRHGKAGAWVIAAGLLRYAFVAAGAAWAWMRQPLSPTNRARAICVIQIAALLVALLPMVQPPASNAIAAAGLAALTYSFAVDTRRLWRQWQA
jgi:phosphatidylglycerophosphate synthase